MIYGALSVFLVKVDDGFRVGVRVEDVSAGLQIPAQFPKVVDLAVEYHPDRSVFVPDRLAAGSDVDNAQTPHAQTDPRAEVITFIVRTAVGDGHAHIPHFLFENRFAFQAHDAGDSTHSPCTLSLLVVQRQTCRNPRSSQPAGNRQPLALIQ